MEGTETIINSILCFINSAKADYDNDKTLEEVVYNFYSHDEVKAAKEILCNILKEDILWRREPDKKRKDLVDVFRFHNRLYETRNTIKFVTDSYKKMPPMGLEILAPILGNLSEEIMKLNETIPKILDIRTEVFNTADTVRQMKQDLVEVKQKFVSAVSGMEEAAKEVTQLDTSTFDDFLSFRRTLGGNEVLSSAEARRASHDFGFGIELSDEGAVGGTSSSLACAASSGTSVGRDDVQRGDATRGRRRNQGRLGYSGAVLRDRNNVGDSRESCGLTQLVDSASGAVRKKLARPMPGASPNSPRVPTPRSRPQPLAGDAGRMDEEGWQHVQSRNSKRRDSRPSYKTFKGVTGARKGSDDMFRAVKRYVDVFIGRVEKGVAEDSIKDYIISNFDVEVVAICKLEIRSDIFEAFKVTVKLSDRDKLFNSDLWPEDIIIDKFYNRRRPENKGSYAK